MNPSGALTCLFLMLVTPYDVVISPLKPACSPIFIFLSLGIQIGLAIGFFAEVRGNTVKAWIIPLSSVLFVGSLVAVSLDWTILLQFDLASADAGWFGTTEFVFFRAWFNECVRPFCTFAAAVAGGMLLLASYDREAPRCGPDPDVPPRKAAACLCTLILASLALGFSSRGAAALSFNMISSAPLATIASATFSGFLLGYLALAFRGLAALGYRANPAVSVPLLFSAGVVVWEAAIRVVPVLDCARASVLLVVLAVALSAITLLVSLRDGGQASRVERADQEEHAWCYHALEGYDLSGRERSVAVLVMGGNTASATAVRLGISASTVRVTLLRVYKKMGIGGMSDLRALSPIVLSGEAVDSAGAQEAGTTSSGASVALVHSMLAALVICICMFPEVARMFEAPHWGLFRGELYALGIALYSAGVSLSFLQLLHGGDYLTWLRDASPRLLISGVGAACLLAVSGEAIRRCASGFGLVDIFVPFEVALALGSILLIGAREKKISAPIGLLLVAAVLACAVLSRGGLHALSLLAVTWALNRIVEDRSAFQGLCAAMLTVHGLFLFGSDYLVNRILDIYFTGGYLTDPFGGPLPFALLVIGIACVAMTVVAFCFVVECLDYVQECMYRKLLGSIELDADRVRHLFLGKGLNSSQSDVLVLIASGKSSAQIAIELCMSRGTVNTARRVGYKKLGIHSKVELMNYISREMGR